MPPSRFVDPFGRFLDYVRISITDRCPFRCRYCYPHEPFSFIPHERILRYEDILYLLSLFPSWGIRKVRITGGEPLVRKGVLPFLVKAAALFPSLYMTTNGYFLKESAPTLKEASLKGVNVSLDTLDGTSFCKLTGVDGLERVLSGIDTSLSLGIPLKINAVAMRETLDQIFPLLSFAAARGVTLRFIEQMPISSDPGDSFLSQEEVQERIRTRFSLEPLPLEDSASPASLFRIPETGQTVGFISALSHPFCHRCSKVRITSDGKIRSCLSSENELSLLEALRERDPASLEKIFNDSLKQKGLKHCFQSFHHHRGRTMGQVGG